MQFGLNYQVYYDQVFLGRFTEEFLDSLIDESYLMVAGHPLKASYKYLREIIMMLEIDRCLIKFINEVVQNFIDSYPNQKASEEFISNSKSHDKPAVSENKEEAAKQKLTSRIQQLASEMLKFTVMSFFKRCKIMLNLLKLVEDNIKMMS